MTGRMSYVDLAWPWGLVTLGLQPLLSPDQDQVEPCEGPCGDQHCQQIVFFGYLSRMTSFHHNSKMLILADSSPMKIRVGLIGGPWLQQLTPLQDSGLNVPQIADEAGSPIHHGDILASHLCKLSQNGPWSSPPACERPPQRRDASLPLSATQALTTHPLS